MKFLLVLTIFFTTMLFSEELRIKAKEFDGDEKLGISVFKGDVNVNRGNDEINASKITINTDKNKQPTKFVAEGDVVFKIKTEKGSMYEGRAQKVIYIPNDKEYHFYKQVHLRQTDDKKEIIGEEVVLKLDEGKAYAKGVDNDPVIMIFSIPEKEK